MARSRFIEKKVCKTSITKSIVVNSSLNSSTLYSLGGLILLRSTFSRDVFSYFVAIVVIVTFMFTVCSMINEVFSSVFKIFYLQIILKIKCISLDEIAKIGVKSAWVFECKLPAVLVLPCTLLEFKQFNGNPPGFLVEEARHGKRYSEVVQ